MKTGLNGKVALVTGASRGIGAAIATTLAAEGCRVMLTARSATELSAKADSIRAAGGEAMTSTLDLLLPQAAEALVNETIKNFGAIDIVVGNAGAAKMGNFLELSDDLWQDGFGLKFFGHMRLARAAWPHLKKRRGSIVFIAGSAGRTPYATSAITGSVNAALLNLTKTLAARGLEDGIRVNAINPGAIRTERYVARLEASIAAGAKSAAEAERELAADRNQAPVGEPVQVANLVTFLAGDCGSHLNGAIIDIDGGKTKTL